MTGASDARDALACIPADLPRDEWVRVGMAAQAAGLGFEEFDAWSARGDSYNKRAASETWRSFVPGKGIGSGTLFRIASEHGYQRAANGHTAAPVRPAAASKRRRPGIGAEVWARCKPATADHPYVAAKHGLPDGLRVVPDDDSLQIAGQSVAGWLAIPVFPIAGGAPTSLQFIAPPGTGKKLNLPGASMSGVFIVGELQAGGTAYLCEGIGQAWACWKADGHAAVCCFGWGNVGKVAAELRRRDTAARLVLVPDAGKEDDAERIAAELGCHVARMPEGSPQNFDCNDLALRDGVDVLEALLAGAKMPPPTEAEAPAWCVPAAATPDEWTTARLAPRCIVENYLFADVASLIAPGSTGKTTMTLHEAACIVLGLPLWGLRVVTPGPVLIVTAEDRREFLVARLREICAAMGLTEAQTARVRELVRIDDRTAATMRRLTAIVADVVSVSGFADAIVAGCRHEGFAPVLVQFDPLVSFGIGEARVNDAEQGLIEAGRVITAGLDCCTRYVHHSGKANARDKAVDQYAGRGGSALSDGCRMVSVMQALTLEEADKLTGNALEDNESAFALWRPKVSYAPPQRNAIYVRRRGYGFRLMQVAPPKTDDQQAAADDDQMLRFLATQVADGMHFTRNTLEAARPASLSRDRARAAIARLLAKHRIEEADIEPKPTNGARTYLRPRSAANREGNEA